MLQRGWDANGSLLGRCNTPLKYGNTLPKLNFDELFVEWNPDLPQTDWMGSRTHAVVYREYRKQYEGHNWKEWNGSLKECQEILRNHGGKVYTLPALLDLSDHPTLKAWGMLFLVLLYTVIFPLALTYGTEDTWTTMSTGQKLGFLYLWGLLSICPPFFTLFDGTASNVEEWIIFATLVAVNQVILPLLIIKISWRPFLSCHEKVLNPGDTAMCQVVTTCTNYSFLLSLAVVGIEFVAVLVSVAILID
ncbi:hypothetical protein F5Y16DRAFT_233045 [Xylariaceae sp. FL0255]|nr:hypothetical protein F5Y16DRAFT_233045 [Xylariaceae sp. FL0255]